MKHSSPIHLGLLAASVAALIAATGLYWYLHHDTISLTEHAIVARKAALDEGQRQKQSKATLALASSTAESRARISGFFVPADDAVAFIQAMESIGPASGATVSIASIGETSPDGSKKGSIGALTAQISLSGTWSDVMNAVELFEVLPYQTSIDHMTLTTSLDAGDRAPSSGHTWQASFTISASTLI